jgi:hypothetical protein
MGQKRLGDRVLNVKRWGESHGMERWPDGLGFEGGKTCGPQIVDHFTSPTVENGGIGQPNHRI